MPTAADWAVNNSQWEALDDVDVMTCAVCTVSVVAEVPSAVRGRWQRAWVDVYDEVYLAVAEQGTSHQQNVTRALKWFLILPQLLLRGARKGVKCLHSAHTIVTIKAAFDQWDAGQRRGLVNQWLQRRSDAEDAKAKHMAPGDRQADEAEAAKRAADMAKVLAMDALEDGQMQKAMNMLTSPGVASLECEVQGVTGVERNYRTCQCSGCSNMRQIEDRHPTRRADVPLHGEFGVGRPMKFDCRERMLGLKRQKAAGVTGTREDHLRAPAQRSGD